MYLFNLFYFIFIFFFLDVWLFRFFIISLKFCWFLLKLLFENKNHMHYTLLFVYVENVVSCRFIFLFFRLDIVGLFLFFIFLVSVKMPIMINLLCLVSIVCFTKNSSRYYKPHFMFCINEIENKIPNTRLKNHSFPFKYWPFFLFIFFFFIFFV